MFLVSSKKHKIYICPGVALSKTQIRLNCGFVKKNELLEKYCTIIIKMKAYYKN